MSLYDDIKPFTISTWKKRMHMPGNTDWIQHRRIMANGMRSGMLMPAAPWLWNMVKRLPSFLGS